MNKSEMSIDYNYDCFLHKQGQTQSEKHNQSEKQNKQQKPVIYFGTYTIKERTHLLNALDYAYECGYRHFDCAYHYKNQAIIGEFIHKKIEEQKRHLIWITSKVSFRMMPKGEIEIRKSIEQTFTDLQTDYVDLMLIHAPEKNDILAWNIITEYKNRGRIRYIGISNFNIEKLNFFMKSIKNPEDIYCNQIEFNPFLNRDELIQRCNETGIKVITYGNLYYTNEIIDSIAQKLEKPKEQILIKYVIQKGLDSIVMATDPDYIKMNIMNMNIEPEFKLNEVDMGLIDHLHDEGNEQKRSKYKRFL
jgi:diketogulonate reductase-like aldo/keto reductase